MTQINRKLAFTFAIEGADGGVVQVYSAPLSRAAFETYYRELGKVFTSCFAGQEAEHVALTAPQLALAALKDAAGANWDPEGKVGVKTGLVGEIKRLTTVAFPGPDGWESLPLDVGIKRGIVDDDGEAEILSNLVFFTAISKVAPRALSSTFLELAAALRDWVFTSSSSTEWIGSLPTSTPVETSTTTLPPAIA